MLLAKDIERILKQQKWKIIGNTERDKAIGFSTTESDVPLIYSNRESKTGASSIIVHPKLQVKIKNIESVEGIRASSNITRDSSAFKKFPVKNNEHYGYAYSAKDERSFLQFLKLILAGIGAAKPYASPEDDIERQKQELPEQETIRKAIINARLGQGEFREELAKLWHGCAVLGIKTEAMLRASHIKPWRDCSNKDRLDPFNGILLSAHLDAAFDRGFISFDDTGLIEISTSFPECEKLGISASLRLRSIYPENLPFLKWHRYYIFKG